MAFIRVENYLAKFKKAASEDFSEKVKEFFKKKFPGTEFDLKVKNKVIYINNSNPGLRSELFLRKRKIIEDLGEVFGDKSPKDISFRKS